MGAAAASKKKILAVNVPKACKTISNQSPPIALRLQGTLLHGTSAVFGKHADYLLADVQRVLMTMQTFSQGLQAQNDRTETQKA